jgi:hyaluronan synthase
MAKRKKPVEDVMLQPIRDRRLLPHAPRKGSVSAEDRRNNLTRRSDKPQYAVYAGQRYEADFEVKVVTRSQRHFQVRCSNISQTGMLLKQSTGEKQSVPVVGASLTLDFSLLPGVLQEGTESHYRIKGTVVRSLPEKGEFAVQFAQPLYVSRRRAKDTMLSSVSVFFLFLITLVILLMRTESVLDFSQNSVLYGYSIVTAAFLLSRYLFGSLYKPVPINPEYTPSITIVIPCFNEAKYISRTIMSCMDQDYPVEKLNVIIVDDGSTDGSVESIKETVTRLWAADDQYQTRNRIRVFFQKHNQGKREAMALGIRNTTTELVGFVDSDSFLEPDAVRNLVQPMYDPKMGGVTGRTDVVNAYTNYLTKMQCVRYYISFRIIKAAESYFSAVTCLSGPLSCYRLSAVQPVLEPWLHQTFLGRKATFGDDRSLTNFVVKNYRTYYQDTAICSTLVPNRNKVFLRQQMRWKRSWLRESLKAGSFMWRKEPLMSMSFYMGLMIPLIAPVIMVYNLIVVPLTLHIFPTTFLLGLLMMSLLMSFTQLRLKKSRLWIYGLWFVVYYEAILLWQMPYAWFTFWVSDWGTRGNKKKTPPVSPAQDSDNG